MSNYQVSSFKSTKLCGLIICQFMVIFVTFVATCPPPGDPPDPTGYPPDTASPRILTDDTTIVVTKKVPMSLNIVNLRTEPEKLEGIGHAWVMICQGDSDPFGQCCISNKLWELEPRPRRKGLFPYKDRNAILGICIFIYFSAG